MAGVFMLLFFCSIGPDGLAKKLWFEYCHSYCDLKCNQSHLKTLYFNIYATADGIPRQRGQKKKLLLKINKIYVLTL